MTCTFVPWLLYSLNLPRYGTEWKKRYTPRLVSRVGYSFDQCSVVGFVIKKLFVHLFMAKQCIYLVTQMYFMQIYFHLLWSANKFTDFFVFMNFLLTLHLTWTIKEVIIELNRIKNSVKHPWWREGPKSASVKGFLCSAKKYINISWKVSVFFKYFKLYTNYLRNVSK